MQNEMRDRLIELIDTADEECKHSKSCKSCSGYGKGSLCTNYHIADHLLADGWIRLPVKIGQTVYVVSRYYGGLWRIHECIVEELTIYGKHIFMSLVDGNYNFGVEKSEIGTTVFLTKEEAEKVLKERREK